MDSAQGRQRLMVAAERLRGGEQIEPLTVREFLSWFNAKRRGTWVVAEIRDALDGADLVTDPDFESTYIDGEIQFLLNSSDAKSTQSRDESGVISGESVAASGASALQLEVIDPTHRISKLAPANNAPVSVSPDSLLEEAITIMLARGFSQLPVQTSPREVKGVVSWQSIGTRLAAGQSAMFVRDVLEQHHEVRHDASIFQAIPLIVANDYVLVRGRDNSITGIVTASDLSLQFLQLSEPFLLLSEIENQIRQIIAKRFNSADLAASCDPKDTQRKVERASDLTFGEYVRLFEQPENWLKTRLPLDRVVFCKHLTAVRDIRNDVMHFDPDGISPSDVEVLREFARFLQRLSAMGIT